MYLHSGGRSVRRSRARYIYAFFFFLVLGLLAVQVLRTLKLSSVCCMNSEQLGQGSSSAPHSFARSKHSRVVPTASGPEFTAASNTTCEGAAAIWWEAKSLYLPITPEARSMFLRHEEKQRLRKQSDPSVAALWDTYNVTQCFKEVPECEFWRAIEAPIMTQKCCVEHMKMKETLFYALDVAEASKLKLFLDSGTLLSSMRDGGHTLLPWETDIDLGVIGVEPSIVALPFAKYESRRSNRTPLHLFKQCLVKVSKNSSRNGMCRDAHYVYYARTEVEASVDTCRVEIWPFWPEPGSLVHPTRKRLTIGTEIVEPLVFGCRMWGRAAYCPHDSVAYLDHEYGAGSWRVPKTIHWGKNNVQPWLHSRFHK